MSNLKTQKSRREFLKSCTRVFAATTLGVLGGGLLLRKSTSEKDSCINEYLCNGCRVFSKCTLPQKTAVKNKINP